jgi:hypothetical protein
MKRNLSVIIILVFFLLNFSQCKKNEEAVGADRELFDLANSGTGFTYFQTDSIRASSNPSAHNDYMRVKFNSIAAAALGSDGKLPSGSSFPNGSLIVKELFNSPTGSLELYAVMKKDSSDSNAGQNWLWAEYEPDAIVHFSVDRKGDGCTVCHGTSPHRDLTRVFDLF